MACMASGQKPGGTSVVLVLAAEVEVFSFTGQVDIFSLFFLAIYLVTIERGGSDAFLVFLG